MKSATGFIITLLVICFGIFMLVSMNAWAVDQMGEANRQLNEILAQLTNLNLTGWYERPIDRTGIHVVPVRDHRSSPIPHLVGCSLRNGGVT